ncbi:hypothetical protein HDU93_000453 [Gonapodya sp. JEL0774]|nr:hypothetical protein HDU93_000453 [Gonapodya sp. JEL0774]
MSTSDIWKFDFDPVKLKDKYLYERDRRLRNDHGAQYITIGEGKGAKYAPWLTDPWAPRRERAPMDIKTTVVLVGSGFSGIQMGAKLKTAGISDFKIIDRASDFGGTWYWNRYPGAACDSEAYCYLPLLEETGYMPSMKYATGSEILQHCWRMAKHFGLYEHAVFQTGIKEFRWDDSAKVWRGFTDRGDKVAARYLVTCGGPINHPHLPDVEGIGSFKGHEFHTARWDYAYTGGNPLTNDFNMHGLKDKRVAIIGTGATAVQCIPFIGASAGKLYVFQRTPSAVDVRNNRPTDPNWWKSLKPGWQAKRDFDFQLLGAGGDPETPLDDGFSESLKSFLSLVKHQMRTGEGTQYSTPELLQLADFRHMERIRRRCDEIVKDKKTAEALKPYCMLWTTEVFATILYANPLFLADNLYCKRPVYSDTYLPTFNRPNVELVDVSQYKGIDKITPNGIVVGGKEFEVDCIIWSTGFTLSARESHHDYKVLGRSGLTWMEKCDKNGGFASLYGMCTSDFPNYWNFGNFQAAVSVNFPSIYNDEAIFIAHVITEGIKRNIETMEVTREAEEAWTQEILKASIANPDFSENCTPGYYNAEGDINLLKSSNRLQPYGAGPLAYRQKIYDYVQSGKLEGFAVKHLDAPQARI